MTMLFIANVDFIYIILLCHIIGPHSVAENPCLSNIC